MKKTKNKGFSLVELIIVIAIMVVLAAVLAPQFIKYVESSKQSTDITNVSDYRAAIEAYAAEKGADSDITLYVGDGKIYASVDLSDVGLAAGSSSATKLKSAGWGTPETEYVFSATTLKWTMPATEQKNSKNPKKSMFDAFMN